MSMVPTGGELPRPFLPAKDFELSKRFYETLGFEKLLDCECRDIPYWTRRISHSALLPERVG